MRINLLGCGVIVRKDSAFSSMVKLDNGDLICGFSRGGGPEVIGGIHRTRSVDQGITWQYEGVIQPSEECDGSREVNTLRLSRLPDGRVIAYEQRNDIAGSTKLR